LASRFNLDDDDLVFDFKCSVMAATSTDDTAVTWAEAVTDSGGFFYSPLLRVFVFVWQTSLAFSGKSALVSSFNLDDDDLT